LRPQTTTPLISECPLQDPSTGLEKQPEPEPGLGWACLGCPARAALAPSLFETAALEDRTDQPASRDTRQTELAWPGRGHFGSLSLFLSFLLNGHSNKSTLPHLSPHPPDALRDAASRSTRPVHAPLSPAPDSQRRLPATRRAARTKPSLQLRGSRLPSPPACLARPIAVSPQLALV